LDFDQYNASRIVFLDGVSTPIICFRGNYNIPDSTPELVGKVIVASMVANWLFREPDLENLALF
jgi:hypothetical protein